MCGLLDRYVRHKNRRLALLFCAKRQRQDALDRSDPPIERKLSSDRTFFQGAFLQSSVSVGLERGHAQGYRQVEARSLFANIGGGKIDGDHFPRPTETTVLDRSRHTVNALANGSIGQSNQLDIRITPISSVHLNLDGQGVDAS